MLSKSVSVVLFVCFFSWLYQLVYFDLFTTVTIPFNGFYFKKQENQ